MIVQAGSGDGSRLVIPMVEHLSLAAQLWAAFGNAEFDRPGPEDLFTHVVRHHDDGWRDVDARPEIDRATGYPWSLSSLPIGSLVDAGRSSIFRNLDHHPYCGLLVSMHIYGLYRGRFGLSADLGIDTVPDTYRPLVNAFLDSEHERQVELRRDLARSADLAEAIAWPRLFQAYSLLQLFDSLAVWMNLRHPSQDGQRIFHAVPRTAFDAPDLRVVSRDGRLTVSPWPFAEEKLLVAFHGWRAWPLAEGRRSGVWDPADLEWVEQQTWICAPERDMDPGKVS